MLEKPRFRQRHPFLFWVGGFIAAVIVVMTVTAVIRSMRGVSGSLGSEIIGVVNIDGMITDSDKTVEWIRTLAEDKTVKGVIVRINSPGGVVGPSQEIYQAVAKLRGKKPVIASMGSVAASGGYYIACGAERIYANPGTLTGSIGVRMELVNAQDLANKLGIKDDEIDSGPMKGAGSPLRPLTPEQRAYLQGLVMDMHGQFVDAVAKGRNMDPAKVQTLADGRGYTGKQALELGLVDELGGMQEAVEAMKARTGITGEPDLVKGPKAEKLSLWKLVTGEADLAEIVRALTAAARTEAAGPRWEFVY
jgi:protease-4